MLRRGVYVQSAMESLQSLHVVIPQTLARFVRENVCRSQRCEPARELGSSLSLSSQIGRAHV